MAWGDRPVVKRSPKAMYRSDPDGGPDAKKRRTLMATCQVCGNDYDKSFQVTMGGGTHTYTFDSFECAIHLLAPSCDHCGCRIIGHGVEDEAGRMFCCAHCARKVGVSEVRA